MPWKERDREIIFFITLQKTSVPWALKSNLDTELDWGKYLVWGLFDRQYPPSRHRKYLRKSLSESQTQNQCSLPFSLCEQEGHWIGPFSDDFLGHADGARQGPRGPA